MLEMICTNNTCTLYDYFIVFSGVPEIEVFMKIFKRYGFVALVFTFYRWVGTGVVSKMFALFCSSED